jgi:hypothetical protein
MIVGLMNMRYMHLDSLDPEPVQYRVQLLVRIQPRLSGLNAAAYSDN